MEELGWERESKTSNHTPAFYRIAGLQFLPFEIPFHWDILIRELAIEGGGFPCGHCDILQRPQKTNDSRFARGRKQCWVTHFVIPSEYTQTRLVIFVVAFFEKERATGLATTLAPMWTGPCGAGKGRAGGRRVGIHRGPFVLLYKVSEKSVLHLSLCQASSSSGYIRYVTSKITETLIGRGQGPLNHIACPCPSNTLHLPKMLAKSSPVLPSRIWNGHTAKFFSIVLQALEGRGL